MISREKVSRVVLDKVERENMIGTATNKQNALIYLDLYAFGALCRLYGQNVDEKMGSDHLHVIIVSCL